MNLLDIAKNIGFVKPVIFQWKKYRPLWSTLYPRRTEETFHEFIIRILWQTLWQERYNNQKKTTTSHYIYECHQAYITRLKELDSKSLSTDSILSWPPNGYVQYLLQLAYDIASLIQTSNVSEEVIGRLKKYNDFQWARYEIAIAGLFARMWFKIDFHNEKGKTSEKHCEFIATSEKYGVSIAVEAKSRHRPWVLNFSGPGKLPEELKIDVNNQIKQALEQNPKTWPFMIFVDLNLPPASQEIRDKDLKAKIEKIIDPKYAEDLWKTNALVITNYSFHFAANEISPPGNALTILPKNPTFEIPQIFYQDLNTTLKNYGHIPDLDAAY